MGDRQNFAKMLSAEKNTMIGLLYAEESMTICQDVSEGNRRTDRRTNGRRDGQLRLWFACDASRYTNLFWLIDLLCWSTIKSYSTQGSRPGRGWCLRQTSNLSSAVTSTYNILIPKPDHFMLLPARPRIRAGVSGDMPVYSHSYRWVLISACHTGRAHAKYAWVPDSAPRWRGLLGQRRPPTQALTRRSLE